MVTVFSSCQRYREQCGFSAAATVPEGWLDLSLVDETFQSGWPPSLPVLFGLIEEIMTTSQWNDVLLEAAKKGKRPQDLSLIERFQKQFGSIKSIDIMNPSAICLAN